MVNQPVGNHAEHLKIGTLVYSKKYHQKKFLFVNKFYNILDFKIYF